MPLSTLTVSVRDASGNPVTGGGVYFQNSFVSPLPGLPGSSGSIYNSRDTALDASGNASLVVPNGITLQDLAIHLSNGLVIPFTAPALNGDQSVTVTVPASIDIQGTLEDSEGNVYTSAQGAGVSFSSPLNPGSTVYVNGSGGFSADVFDDQNFSVVAFGESSAGELQFTLPVGTLDQDETYNVVMPVSTLTVSVRDASGNPVTGGGVYFQNSFISPLPGLPGSSGSIYNSRDTALDANGNASLVVPNGITLQDLAIHLSNGLVVPFTAPALNGDQSVTVTVPASIDIQGTLEDSEGNVYTSAQGAGVSFSSPLNPGSTVYVNGSGGFSADVFDDQNFSVVAVGVNSEGELQFTLPVGTLDQDETYNVVMPVSTLTVSVRDASGNPVTGGGVYFQNSFISPLPGLPGSSGSIYNSRDTALDANGNASLVVPNGITLQDLAIHLSNGLVLPFTLPAINGDQHVFLIFNAGTLIVDQPPVVTGTPNRPANADGWYNAPVTITWTSTSPAGSPGPPTTPPPTTVSAEGANQVITSAPSCDPAGDCATGTVTRINLDMTPPSVSVTGVTSGATYGQAPSAGCATSDSLSGVATNATISVTNSGTSYTATCSGAPDNAGNQAAPVSVTYQVIPAGWTTASLSDSNGNPISGAAVVFRSARDRKSVV